MTTTSAALASWVQARLFVEDKGINPSIAYNNHDTAVAVYAQQYPTFRHDRWHLLREVQSTPAMVVSGGLCLGLLAL